MRQRRVCVVSFFFFFQAEDGIRDVAVTGVQTCALPISSAIWPGWRSAVWMRFAAARLQLAQRRAQERAGCAVRPWSGGGEAEVVARCEIGRASCRERV